MNKKILTKEKMLENLTYDLTNICYKDNIHPIFRVTNEGLTYKAFELVENGNYIDISILTTYFNNGYTDIACYDEYGNKVDIIKTYKEIKGTIDSYIVEYYTIDSSYWEKHNKIIVFFSDPEDDNCGDTYEKSYTKEDFVNNIPCYDYSIIEKRCDNISSLQDSSLVVETNEGFAVVDAKILHKLLTYLSKV